MRNPRNEARLGGKDFREFRDFKEFRERGMIQEPPSGLAGTGGRDRALGMAPPYRGPGYVTRWLSATGMGLIREEMGGELAIIAWIAVIAGIAARNRCSKDAHRMSKNSCRGLRGLRAPAAALR